MAKGISLTGSIKIVEDVVVSVKELTSTNGKNDFLS